MSNITPVLDVTAMTIEQFKKALPDKVKKTFDINLINQVTKLLADPDMFEQYRDNMLGYTSVMADGRFKIDQYLNAVKYVSHKLMGCTNLDAYTKTFPDKMSDFVNRNIASKDIASYVTAYNKSKCVNQIMEQTLVPSYVLNQDLYQKALNVQAELMISANSEKVRTDAANSLLTHLKMPDVSKVQLDITTKGDSSIDALRESTLALVQQQQILMRQGLIGAKEIAENKLTIEGELVND